MFPLQELCIEVFSQGVQSIHISYKIASFFFLSCFLYYAALAVSVQVFIYIPYVTKWLRSGYVIASSFGYKGFRSDDQFLAGFVLEAYMNFASKGLGR
jgi:hypothetical protein